MMMVLRRRRRSEEEGEVWIRMRPKTIPEQTKHPAIGHCEPHLKKADAGVNKSD